MIDRILYECENSKLKQIKIIENNELFKGNNIEEYSIPGRQKKWYIDNLYIKEDTFGNESAVEVFVTLLLHYSNLVPNKDYVEYFNCNILRENKSRLGCYSKNYLQEGTSSISLYNLLDNENLYKKRISYEQVIYRLKKITGKDFTEYINLVCCIDAIISNEDRHLNNIEFTIKGKGIEKSPIIDNGGSCFQDTEKYKGTENIEMLLNKVAPFSFDSSFEKLLTKVKNTKLKIDYSSFINSIEVKSEEYLRIKEIIVAGLNRYKGKAWVDYER